MLFFYKKLAQVNDEATVIILCSGNANNLDFGIHLLKTTIIKVLFIYNIIIMFGNKSDEQSHAVYV